MVVCQKKVSRWPPMCICCSCRWDRNACPSRRYNQTILPNIFGIVQYRLGKGGSWSELVGSRLRQYRGELSSEARIHVAV